MDFSLAVRYGIAIHVYMSKLQRQTTKLPNFLWLNGNPYTVPRLKSQGDLIFACPGSGEFALLGARVHTYLYQQRLYSKYCPCNVEFNNSIIIIHVCQIPCMLRVNIVFDV